MSPPPRSRSTSNCTAPAFVDMGEDDRLAIEAIVNAGAGGGSGGIRVGLCERWGGGYQIREVVVMVDATASTSALPCRIDASTMASVAVRSARGRNEG